MPWHPAAKVSTEPWLRDLVAAPKYGCERVAAPGRPRGSPVGVKGRSGSSSVWNLSVPQTLTEQLMSLPSVHWEDARGQAQLSALGLSSEAEREPSPRGSAAASPAFAVLPFGSWRLPGPPLSVSLPEGRPWPSPPSACFHSY